MLDEAILEKIDPGCVTNSSSWVVGVGRGVWAWALVVGVSGGR